MQTKTAEMNPTIATQSKIFQTRPSIAVLRNRKGSTATFSSYGARWISMVVSDRNGCPGEVLLGFDRLSDYLSAAEQYYGATVGRVCQRIAGANFSLGERSYDLARNDSYGKPHPNHLHGGIHAFHNKIWQMNRFETEAGDQAVQFRLHTHNGEEGYPGNIDVRITYILLSDEDRLEMEFWAQSDTPTPLNITNHAFFNLSGLNVSPDISSHKLTVAASHMIECDDELIPTGRLLPVEGAYYDFRTPRKISDAIASAPLQVRRDGGFSLAFMLDKHRPECCEFAARLEDDTSGRTLEMYTTQRSLQIYNGYLMSGKDIGRNGIPHIKNCGITLEHQGFPDAMHHPEFPSVITTPDTPYRHKTTYVFSTN